MTTSSTAEQVAFYAKLVKETVDGLLKTVCQQAALPLEGLAHWRDLGVIPIYETGPSLLSLANELAPTTILFPAVAESDYLQAYWKKMRGADGQVSHEIVVITANYCWARFYAAKELMHCFIEEDGIGATGSRELVHDLIESLAAGGITGAEECAPQTIVDEVAMLGAILFMVPEQWMPTIAALFAALTIKFPAENAYLYIATILRVPEMVVRHRLKQFAGSLTP